MTEGAGINFDGWADAANLDTSNGMLEGLSDHTGDGEVDQDGK